MTNTFDFTLALPAATAALPLSCAVSAATQIETKFPFRYLVEQWKSVDAAFLAVEEGTKEEGRLWKERLRVDELICETRAATVSDLAAQLEYFLEEASGSCACDRHRPFAAFRLSKRGEGRS